MILYGRFLQLLEALLHAAYRDITCYLDTRSAAGHGRAAKALLRHIRSSDDIDDEQRLVPAVERHRFSALSLVRLPVRTVPWMCSRRPSTRPLFRATLSNNSEKLLRQGSWICSSSGRWLPLAIGPHHRSDQFPPNMTFETSLVQPFVTFMVTHEEPCASRPSACWI